MCIRDRVLPDAAGARRTVRILETTGINGIWMLCWLETAASAVSRVDLVAALLDCFGHEDATTLAARFIPVFAGNAPDSSVSAELQVLEEMCIRDRAPAARQRGGTGSGGKRLP